MEKDSRTEDDGFTLLEILAALVVLGFLMAGLAGGVRLGMQAWDAQDRAIAAHDELDAVDRALRQLIGQAEPGDQVHASSLAGDESRLALATRLLAERGGAVDAALGLGKGARLVLRWAPRRFGKPFNPPPPAREAALLDGVESVRFAYWPSGVQGGWHSVWDGPDPPALIRISLTFKDPARHWPDIVAALGRDRMRSGGVGVDPSRVRTPYPGQPVQGPR